MGNKSFSELITEAIQHVFQKLLFFRKIKQLSIELILLIIGCLICIYLVTTGIEFYYVRGAEPPLISEENNALFLKKYVIPKSDDDGETEWYTIVDFPLELVGSWRFDYQLKKIQFSNRKQADINRLRHEYYLWNQKEAAKKTDDAKFWICFLGITCYLLIKIKRRICEIISTNQF